MSLTLEIPAEFAKDLTDLIQAFTVAVIKEKPDDLVSFAADYFVNLQERRDRPGEQTGDVKFGGGAMENFKSLKKS
ncbi:PRKAR2B [Branchiostoma lanceolatum]|uniref:PRKAR2B protein n=1 Tax=Branchiostoma lanceolatum TaxID=7740 RepID=A0A8K0A4A3_BRALA|nr:PRKAR2B [Branchiostoma lanceolatum]